MRWLAVSVLLAACSSTRSAETHATATLAVAEEHHVTEHDVEERGPVTTVVEEFEPAAPEVIRATALGEQPPNSSAGNAVATPVLRRRTTITQAPIGTAGPAFVVKHNLDAEIHTTTDAKASLDDKSAARSAPALGCQAAGLLWALAALGALALALAAARRFHWIP